MSRRTCRRIRFLNFLIAAFLGTTPAWPQVSAAISGKVEDASGAAIGGATVTVKSLETGATRVATTDESGNFRALSLPLGPQEVKAEKQGFKSAIRTGIRLEVGQEAVVNFKLDVGELVQQVTVSEEVPVVNTTTAPVSGVVGEREVKDLPLNGRSFDNLITLNPGTVNFSAMKSANTSTSNGNTFTVDGRRTSENIFLLNGVEYTGSSQLAITPGGVSGELLGIDAVREFNVLTDTYDAEYGKRAGAQVSVATQSGTNVLHGTIFEFLRNSALDARNFFDEVLSAPPFRRNQFGGALGGPLKKDKLFLFGNYEGFRQALALSNVAVVPDNEARLGMLPNTSTGVYSTVANLNPAMLQYMSFWPAENGSELLAPTGPGGAAEPTGAALNYSNPRETIREDFGTVRSDYGISERDTVSAAYTIDDGNSLIPMTDPFFGSTNVLRNQVASITETHVISPSILNTATVGFSRAAFNYGSFLFSTFPASDSFVTGEGPGGIVIGGGLTTTGGSSAISSAGPNNAAKSWNRRNLFTYTDGVQITKGMHQLSVGVWFQRIRDNEDSASRQLGQASFASLTTFLQGTVTSFQVIPDPNELGWRSWFGAWYAQDAIKLRPNLTLQLGIRDEFTNGWNEESGRAANYIAANGVLEPNPVVGNSAFTQNNATHLFAPRVGLAWDVFGNGKTAIRSGFGTYYSLIDDLSFQLNSVPPYNGSVSLTGSLPSLVPITPGVEPAPQCSATVPKPCTTYAPQGVQTNAYTPTVEEWNFKVEQQIDQNTVLRLGYVGSHGYHGFLSVDPNTVPAQVCASASGCVSGGVATSGAPATTTGLVPQGAQYIPVGTRPDSYLGAGFFWYTEGNTSYNALQVDVTRRLTHGLQFRANYTWSKNLDMNSAFTGAQANNQAQMILNRNDLPLDWGPSALNIANQGSISASYALPFGRNLSGFEGKLIRGWQVNGIATLLSGFPFTPQIGSNRSGDGDTRNPDRPSLNPSFSGPVILGSPNQWYNPNAFILPTVGTYGNVGRGVFTGPGLADLDVSLFKTVPVTERVSLQIRAELFNVLNHANFGPPNATVFSGTSISGSAGLITTTTTTSRQIQFGMKLIF
ncbi:MAG TPA: carboxypeptidase regulatory-like domain-containing protein [Bryobacteraceae bacterium]|nr:carboxypeptidase regulatory-like domain-containing protein [Bryobacteraceae bacterium]